jgi:hypothetical protein
MAYILQTKKEEIQMWNQCMDMLEFDMPWVLANLEKLETFKVAWNNYGRHSIQCPVCLKYNKKHLIYCKNCQKDLQNERLVTFGVGKPTGL